MAGNATELRVTVAAIEAAKMREVVEAIIADDYSVIERYL